VDDLRAYIDALIGAHINLHEQERRAADLVLADINRIIGRLEAAATAMADRLDRLEKWHATSTGRISVIVGLVGVLSGFIGLVLGHLIFGSGG
jgi:hypothetical protein